MKKFIGLFLILLVSVSVFGQRRLELLFLGDNGHHQPFNRYPALQKYLGAKGLNLTYVSSLEKITPAYLAKFDALVLYANHDSIGKAQETAILEYVKNGGGFVPIHCASYCFRNSKELVKLMGGQFWTHTMDSIHTVNTLPNHEILKDYQEIKTVDETYMHTKLQKDNIVLQTRKLGKDQLNLKPGQTEEPYTWIRNYGKGRVFYTAYGHDERTWEDLGFLNLVTKGILWAVGEQKQDILAKLDLPSLHYRKAKLPNYEKRENAMWQQIPLSPEESMKFIQVPVDFNLSLFASEPDVMHPIAMTWDHRGRMYVLITKDYPNERKESGGSDYILICEDTDKDGKADKFTKFAEGLSIPTSLVFTNGGLVVSQAPDMLFLKDTDGDDKADIKKVIFSGFGTFDTHAGPSNLHYGFDNWIYGSVGYSGFKGTVGGQDFNFGQALFRFKADGSKMEHLTTTSNNTWGLDLNEAGTLFASTANNAHGWYMAIPHRNIPNAPRTINGSKNTDTHKDMRTITGKIRQVDVFGGYTAASGHNFYSARSFPKEYWNQIAFVSEPTGHVVHQNHQIKSGSDYNDQEAFNLLAGADEWVSPVYAQVGPDGAVWVADWYSFIIQHNPTPVGFENGGGNAYDTDLRDYTHGRIYRVGYNGAPEYNEPKLSPDDWRENIRQLTNSNLFWRLAAQRLLVENPNPAMVGELVKLIKDQSIDEIGLNPGAIHAIWTLEGAGLLQSEEVIQAMIGALHHPSSAVRMNAMRAAPKTNHAGMEILKAGLLEDEDLEVQLAAINALVEIPNKDSKIHQALMTKIAKEQLNKDRWIPEALAAYVLQLEGTDLNQFISQASNEKLIVSGDVLGRDLNNPKTNIQTNGLDLVVEELIIDKGTFKYQEGSGFSIKVKNIGDLALPKDVELPLHITITGAGRKLDIDSYTFKDGLAPGESGLVLKNTNGPWSGNFGWTPEEEGDYIMEIKLNHDNKLSAENLSNNIFRQKFEIRNTKSLNQVILERIGRNMGLTMGAHEIVEFLSFQEVNTLAFGSLLKGINRTWNTKKELDLLEGDGAKLLELFGNSPAEFKGDIEILAENFKVDLPNDSNQEVVKILIKTVKEAMQFDLKSFTVPAGALVELTLENVDAMQHNLVIGQMGSKEIIGAAADKMITQSDAADKNYVPNIPEVIASTPMVNPENKVRIKFTAPDKQGDYPYVCTFPGHWSIMNGIMTVK